MTREDVQDFLAMVQAAYPNYNPPSKTAAVNAWTMALDEYDKDSVALAFKAYMHSNTSGFAPAPGQIIDIIYNMTAPRELNEIEAWSLVRKALENSGYNSVDEFAKLPPLVQKAVGLPNQLRIWAIDENYNEQVVSSNFMRCYRNELARHEELSNMPEDVRNFIEGISKNSYSAQIEQKREQAIKSLTERKESEIKALEAKEEYVHMPDDIKKRLEEWKNE